LCALGLLLVALVLVAFVTIRHQHFMIQNRQSVLASYELSVLLDRLFMLLQQAENAEQAYLLSGNESSLAPFERAVKELDPTFDQLLGQSRKNAEIFKQLQTLRNFYAQEVGLLKKMIEARRQRGEPLPSPLSVNVADDAVMENIRTLPNVIKEEQRLFRVGASEKLLQQTETANSQLILLIVTAVCSVGGCAVYAVAQLRAKDSAIAMVRQVAHETVVTQEKLSAVLTSMDEGLCLINNEGKIDYMNRAGERLLGHNLSDVVAVDMHDLVHSFCQEVACPLRQNVSAGAYNRNQDDTFSCKDGSFLPVHYIISPLVSNGAISGAVLAFIDISERKLDEMSLKAQQEVTTILAEGTDLNQSVNQIISLICNYFDWQLGALWLVDKDHLRCQTMVKSCDQDFTIFEELSVKSKIAHGEGLPGRVWSTSSPAWIRDVVEDANFPRSDAAASNNLHGAFALPIMAGNDFIGVLEFFSHVERERDDDQLATFTSICSQVGQFIQRLKAYELLEQSEIRYSLALDGSMDGIWDWTVDTGEVFLSPRWKELLGYSDDEANLNHQEFFDLIHDDDKAIVRQALDRHIRGETPIYSAVFRIKNKAGEYRWFSGRGRAQRDENGRALRLSGSNRDITEERNAAEKLRKSEQKFQAIFDTMFEFLGMLSPDGILLEGNRAALDFAGIKREEVIGKPFWSGPWFEEKDHERLKLAIKNAAAGSFDRFQMEHTNEQGTITVDFSISPVFDNAGEVAFLIPEGRDITHIRTIEAKLKESEGLFRQLAENVREIFWIATPDNSKFFYVSPAYEEITGRSRDGIDENPSSFFDPLEPEDRKQAFKDFKEFARAETIKEGEYRIIRPDGTICWIAAKVFPVRDDEGNLVRICGVARDINERKEAERRVSEFYSTVSHELRSPLTSIRGSLGLIEGGLVGDVSDKARTFVTIARAESDRLIRLINNILDLRKIEAGKLELRLSDIAVTDLVDGVLGALQGMAAEKNIELLVPDKIDLAITVDKDLISQVLTNLISNAVKFSPTAAKVIVHLKEENTGFLRIAVEDFGPGIPASQAHKLFGKFQQVDSSDTRSQGGTGLGLAISKAIVEQHGGIIGFDSVEGHGATFWFKLPVPGREDSARPRVLVFSRDGLMSGLLRTATAIDSVVTVAVSTVDEAVRLLHEESIDVLVMDVGQSPQSAMELFGKFSKLHLAIPVIVFSGQPIESGAYGDALVLDGITDLIDGPTFGKTVKEVLDRSRREALYVLIVEDDPASRAVVRHQIGELGLRSLEAHDGEQALAMIRKQMPDLIVLDVGLPRLDGFAVVAALRREAKNVPIVIYSARDLSREEKESLSLGLTRFLTKSHSTVSDLLAAIRELLSGIVGAKR